ncbi:MAG: hypothetical protein LBP78_05395 [Acidaminococcales bacterium]|nr:hypothetical protein [Acidaminococcales bacterium]
MQKIIQWFFSTGTALERLTVKAAEEQQKYANRQVYKALAAGAWQFGRVPAEGVGVLKSALTAGAGLGRC